MKKIKPVGSDENLNVYSLDEGIVFGIWKEGGEIAFIALSNGLHDLVKRCIMGSASEMFISKEESPTLTQSSYGLYGYSCTIQLRTMKQDLWDHQFSNVECPNSDISNGFARFNLVKEHERLLLPKELTFPWKTDAFKGKVKDVCCLDVVLTNNEGKIMWFCSSAVNVRKYGNRKFTFEMDFDYCREHSKCIEYSDQSGKICMQIDKDEESTYITHLSLQLCMNKTLDKEKDIANKPLSSR